jgi:hypothetical protein
MLVSQWEALAIEGLEELLIQKSNKILQLLREMDGDKARERLSWEGLLSNTR